MKHRPLLGLLFQLALMLVPIMVLIVVMEARHAPSNKEITEDTRCAHVKRAAADAIKCICGEPK